MYLSAVSANIQSIFEPGSEFSATFTAVAKVDPPEIPVMIPSLLASSFAQNIPSAPATGNS